MIKRADRLRLGGGQSGILAVNILIIRELQGIRKNLSMISGIPDITDMMKP